MSQFITIAHFTLPQDMHLAQAKLESAGIETFAKDELTVQTDNFLSNAIGGVRLQVRSNDFDLAAEILREMDIEVEGDHQPTGYTPLQVVVLALIVIGVIAFALIIYFNRNGLPSQ